MFILEIPQNFNWNKNSWLGKKKEWNSSDFHVYSYKYLFNDLNQTGGKYNKFWDQNLGSYLNVGKNVGSYHFILDALSCILLDKIFCTWSWLIVNAVPHSSVNWEGICKGADRLWNVLHLRYVLETLYTILSTGDNA